MASLGLVATFCEVFMKHKTLSILIIISAVTSFANVKEAEVKVYFTPGAYSIRGDALCPLMECAADDEAKMYTRECNYLRRSPISDPPPWVQLGIHVERVEGEKKEVCFCRCDMADEMAARELNQEIKKTN